MSHAFPRKPPRSPHPLTLAALVVLGLLGAGRAAVAQVPIAACPFTTAGAGNYEVTHDLAAAGDCITINHDDVVIDLQGHSIQGDGISGPGITDGGNARSGIIVHHGIVGGFLTGIHLRASTRVMLDQLIVSNNVEGMRLLRRSTVTRTTVSGNGGDGILLFGCCHTLRDVIVTGNGGNGINGLNNGTTAFHCCSVLTRVKAKGNLNGIFLAGGGNGVTHSAVTDNLSAGIWFFGGDANLVSDSQITHNGTTGIVLQAGRSAVLDTTVTRNGTVGIALSSVGDSTIVGGHADGNGSDGVVALGVDATRVVSVTASHNAGSGLVLQTSNLVVASSTRSNAGSGLETTCPSNVLLLQSSGNGVADLTLGGTVTDCALLETPPP